MAPGMRSSTLAIVVSALYATMKIPIRSPMRVFPEFSQQCHPAELHHPQGDLLSTLCATNMGRMAMVQSAILLGGTRMPLPCATHSLQYSTATTASESQRLEIRNRLRNSHDA